MTLAEKIAAAKKRQQQILDASRAAGNTNLTDDEQREFDNQQMVIDALSSVDAPEDGARSADDEKQRILGIQNLGRSFNVNVDKYIEDGSDMDTVRAAVLEQLKSRSHGMSAGSVEVTDAVDRFRSAAADALCLKGGVPIEKAAPGAEEMRGRSLRDIARESIILSGTGTTEAMRMSDEDMLRSFFNPEASFPAILDSAIKKSIVEAHKEVPTTFQKWTTKGSLSDFKETKDREYLLGSFSEFERVHENGELVADTIDTDIMPTRKLESYGKSFSMTRQAFIDDDIGFLAALPQKYTKSALMTIDAQCYRILAENATVYDGKNLFHASHNNTVSTDSAPTAAAIQSMILKGRMQKDPFGKPMLWTPKVLIVGVGYEFDLATIFKSAQIVGSANNDVNPLYNYPLEVVQSPVLNAIAGNGKCPWFITADKNSCAGIQVDYLNGQEKPTIRRMEKPGVLGLHWDIWMDWGITVRDYRGFVKNGGAVISV